jgi:rod shape-determining protein MreD
MISMIAALVLAIAPMPNWAETFRPDWVTLTLIYWAMNLPRTYSVGWAWVIGLILDVAQGTLLGQHALALTLVIFVTVRFHLQLAGSQLLGTGIEWGTDLALVDDVIWRCSLPRAKLELGK